MRDSPVFSTLHHTLLHWRGKPMVCSPEDALKMLYGSDLRSSPLDDFVLRKRPVG